MQVQGYSYSLSNMTDHTVILTREKVEQVEGSLDHLNNSAGLIFKVLLQPSSNPPHVLYDQPHHLVRPGVNLGERQEEKDSGGECGDTIYVMKEDSDSK